MSCKFVIGIITTETEDAKKGVYYQLIVEGDNVIKNLLVNDSLSL